MEVHDVSAIALWLLGLVLIASGTLLVRRFGPLVRAQREYAILWQIATMACRAAEQLGATREWTGDEKKRFAVEVLRSALARVGIEVTDAELDAAIEAAVREMNASERWAL